MDYEPTVKNGVYRAEQGWCDGTSEAPGRKLVVVEAIVKGQRIRIGSPNSKPQQLINSVTVE